MKRLLLLFILALVVCVSPVSAVTRVSPQMINGKPVFIPEAYGALGNGIHDDSDAIQAANDAASAYTNISSWTFGIGGGAKVLFQSPIYRITKELTFGKPTTGNVGFTWEGIGDPVIYYDGAVATAVGRAMIQANTPSGSSGAYVNCTIKGIQFWANRKTSCLNMFGGTLGELHGQKKWTIEKCKFKQGNPIGVSLGAPYGYFGSYDADAANNVFRQCEFAGCEKGIHIEAYNAYCTTVDQCQFQYDWESEANYRMYDVIQLAGQKLAVSNCYFAPGSSSYECAVYANYGDAPVIRDCHSEDPRILKMGAQIDRPGGGIYNTIVNNQNLLQNTYAVYSDSINYPFDIKNCMFNASYHSTWYPIFANIYTKHALNIENVDIGRYGKIVFANPLPLKRDQRESMIDGLRPGQVPLLNPNWDMASYTAYGGSQIPAGGYAIWQGPGVATYSPFGPIASYTDIGTYSWYVTGVASEPANPTLYPLARNGIGLEYRLATESNRTDFANGVTVYFEGYTSASSMTVGAYVTNMSAGDGQNNVVTWRDDPENIYHFCCALSACPTVAEKSLLHSIYLYGVVDTAQVFGPASGTIYINRVVITPGWRDFFLKAPMIRAALHLGGYLLGQ